MNILIVGSGGREHAMIKALGQSKIIKKIHACPGRQGFEQDGVTCHQVKGDDLQGLLSIVDKYKIDLVVFGPEDPLVLGVGDALREKGILVFGPSKAGAKLEGSKVYSKSFMEKYKIPTAAFRVVQSVAEVKSEMAHFSSPYVFKVDGLAAGKGVYICETKEELINAAKEVFDAKRFGSSGKEAVIEAFQPGWELSYIILTNGSEFQVLPLSQDHKRIFEGDKGPNTGGMGVVGPLEIAPDLQERINNDIVLPTLEGLIKEGALYRGALYIGIMVTEEGPKVIEYNVRFGDPEAQIIFPLVKNDWAELFYRVAKGEMVQLQLSDQFGAVIVMAAENYPSEPIKGAEINGNLNSSSGGTYFLHCGTKREKGKWVTDGGRVLNCVSIGPSLDVAIEKAYEKVNALSWKGMQMRKDIGSKVLAQLNFKKDE